MNAIALWTLVIAAELLAWAVKTNLLDHPINRLAAELVRAGKAEPDAAKQELQQRRQRLNDILSGALLAAILLTVAALPPLPSPALYAAVQTAQFGWLIAASLLLLLQLELSPYLHQTVGRMRMRGLLAEGLKIAIAVVALVVIVTLPVSEAADAARPIDLYRVRQFLLGNVVLCGGLTLYREYRRRVRAGDMLRYGTLDSLSVALQVLVLFAVVAVAVAAPTIMLLRITGLLDPRETIAAGLNFLAFLWTCVSIAYIALYLLRRISQARGFSWIDPPNWRVAIPHLGYHFGGYGFFQLAALIGVSLIIGAWLTRPAGPFGWASAPLRWAVLLIELAAIVLVLLYRFRAPTARGLAWLAPSGWPAALALAFQRGFSPPLADVVRVAYLRALFPQAQDDDQLVDLVARGATIAPLGAEAGARLVRFNVIGDPGEGDDSQLYPANRRHGAAKQMISASKERKAAPAPAEPPRSDDQLLQALFEQPQDEPDDPEAIDFTIISSDVIYPGGEMADYERAFYRPNAPRDSHGRMLDRRQATARSDALREVLERSSPVYAIPGNHDWYDSLHGFLLNFAYNATIGRPDPRVAGIERLPWDWRPWRWADRRRVAQLRRRYRLRGAGGQPGARATHQHLSFFELTFGAAPLAVFGLDNGVTGSIDHIQYKWLARRLAEIRADPATAGHYVFVLVGNPLYVDGQFAGEKEARRGGPPPRQSYSVRKLYELLRRHRVDVVMGGDTHAYQRYEVLYTDDQGRQHTMHHIVNGGGGAYLSTPMDAGWLDFDPRRRPRLRLSRRSVYHPSVWGEDRAADARADQVILHDLFPTYNDMMRKFVWSQAAANPASGVVQRVVDGMRRRYIAGALASGFTNALNHDEPPLLQSYVRVELAGGAGGWRLQLLPYIEQDDQDRQRAMRPQPDRQLELEVRREPRDQAGATQATSPTEPVPVLQG
jgi:hypothetical protein